MLRNLAHLSFFVSTTVFADFASMSSIQHLGENRYQVICQDQSEEVASEAQIRSGNICTASDQTLWKDPVSGKVFKFVGNLRYRMAQAACRELGTYWDLQVEDDATLARLFSSPLAEHLSASVGSYVTKAVWRGDYQYSCLYNYLYGNSVTFDRDCNATGPSVCVSLP